MPSTSRTSSKTRGNCQYWRELAANSLRHMVGQQVLLSVPYVRAVTRQADQLVEKRGAKKLAGVQSFAVRWHGAFDLPETQSLELVRSTRP